MITCDLGLCAFISKMSRLGHPASFPETPGKRLYVPVGGYSKVFGESLRVEIFASRLLPVFM